MVTQIFLVRHGQSVMNEKRILQGSRVFKNNGLTKKGQEQIRQTANILKEKNIQKMYTSPLQRCVETSNIISEALQIEYEESDLLVEQSAGEWEGRKTSELYSKEHKKMIQDEEEIVPPRGEPINKVQVRAVSCLKNIIEKNKDKNIVIVTHGAVLQAIIGYYLSVPLKKVYRIKIVAGSIFRLKAEHPQEILFGIK